MTVARFPLVALLLVASPTFAVAQLRVTEPAVNLGELRGGAPVQHRFDFVNESTDPIDIVDVRLGCGCMKPTLEKRALQPGEKGSLILQLRTLGQPGGAHSWHAFIVWRQKDKVIETRLTLAATIVNEIMVEPSILAMSVATSLRQEISFTDHRALPAKILRVLASSPAIKVQTLPQAGGVTKIILDVSAADLKNESEEATITIYTSDLTYRELQVPITLTKAQKMEVTATPTHVELIGNGSQLVRLRRRGDQPLRIEKVELSHPAIACTWAAGPGNDATLKIRLKSDALDQSQVEVNVRVLLAEPAGVALTLPVRVRRE